MPRHEKMSLKFEQWSAPDRQAWAAATTNGDTLAPGGTAAHWKASTARTVMRSYGHWQVWALEAGLLDPVASSIASVTPENVALYVEHLKPRVAGLTLAGRISQLYMAASVMAPKTEWGWLRDMWLRIERWAKPLRDKEARLVDVADLLACGIQAMEQAENGTGQCLYDRAKLFRDGFLVALLALRPLRLANYTQIELGRHLVRREEGYWLSFSPDETKNERAISVPFPEALVPYLEKYLKLYRPVFWRNPKRDLTHQNKLWLSSYGRGLCENMVYRRIMGLTEKLLGFPVNPHAFRHAAATTIAFTDPEHVHINKCILTHTRLSTSERYYNLAQATEAARRYHAHIDSLRSDPAEYDR